MARYKHLLIEANQALSLIAPSTEATIWTRHLLDSAQLLPLVEDQKETLFDVGTGAGFPGLVLAILGHPRVHLVEHNLQKVAFLRRVTDELRLPVTIHPMKSEALKSTHAGIVTARALKPLGQLIALSRRLIGPSTRCVFPKGRRAEAELTEALEHWSMKVERFPSMTDPESTIFRLSHIEPATLPKPQPHENRP